MVPSANITRPDKEILDGLKEREEATTKEVIGKKVVDGFGVAKQKESVQEADEGKIIKILVRHRTIERGPFPLTVYLLSSISKTQSGK